MVELYTDNLTPFYQYKSSINNIQYTFQIMYNNRNDSWFLSIYSGVTPILEGFQLVEGIDILKYCGSELKPDASLYLLKKVNDNTITRCGKYNLSIHYGLYYE